MEPQASKYHKGIMDLRNQHVAHSGASPFRKVFGHLIKNLPNDPNPFHGISRHKIDLAVVSSDDTIAFINHIGSVQNAVKKKLEKIELKLRIVAERKGIK